MSLDDLKKGRFLRRGRGPSVLFGLCAISLILVGPAVHADAAAERGREIFEEAERRDQGFGDFTAELTMTLKDRQGRESVRRLRNRTLEQTEDGDKVLLVFDEPADVQGTALLVHTHRDSDDDLWLYLPALKRVKRISGSNQSGPFMGSEFAYEDLGSTEIAKYTYRYVRDDVLEGQPVFVVERFPSDERSGYTKQVVWVDQEHYRTLSIEYFDRKASHLKTLTQSDFERYLDKYWRPGTLTMVNHQSGKTSVLEWGNYQFGNGLTERDFDRNSLARIR